MAPDVYTESYNVRCIVVPIGHVDLPGLHEAELKLYRASQKRLMLHNLMQAMKYIISLDLICLF